MMKTFITLLKTTLNVSLEISALKYRFTREKKKLWEPILVGISVLIGAGTMIAVFSALLAGIFVLGLRNNQPEIVLIVSFAAAQLLILVLGIFYIMSIFYFSKDVNILIPLPVKPSYILGSKLIVVMLYEYVSILPILLPSFLIYGIGTSQGILYWLKSLILFFAVPIIPLAIDAILIVLLMRVINIRKSRELIGFIAGLIGIAFAIGINFFSQRIAGRTDMAEGFILGNTGLVEIIGRRFPPVIWATHGLSRQGLEGLGNFSLFILAAVLLFAALMWLGNRFFYKGLLSGQEVKRKRRALTDIDINHGTLKDKSIIMVLFRREWKMFLRTPIYVTNGIVGMIIAPFLVIMPFIANPEAENEILPFIQNPDYIVPVTLGGLALMLFTSNMNIVANTSLSREGQMFWISKMIPVSPRQQIMAKVVHGTAVELIGIVITGIVLVAVLKFSVLRTLVLIILGTLGSALMVVLNLMVDVFHPKLDWSSPQEAVKRNINGFFGILVSFFTMTILGGAVLLLLLLKVQEWLIYSILGFVIILVLIPSVIGIFLLADWKYRDIEV